MPRPSCELTPRATAFGEQRNGPAANGAPATGPSADWSSWAHGAAVFFSRAGTTITTSMMDTTVTSTISATTMGMVTMGISTILTTMAITTITSGRREDVARTLVAVGYLRSRC